MPKIDEAVINFAVYEGGTEFLGMAEVSLPEISNLTAEVKGAGINGTFESVIRGHVEAMTLGLNFRTLTKDAIRLFEPKNHQIDLRVAQQSTENTSGNASVIAVKHVFIVAPKKLAPGKVAPATPADASGEYPVTYWACYINGERKIEIDILNFKYEINGVDYLANVRKALGK